MMKIGHIYEYNSQKYLIPISEKRGSKYLVFLIDDEELQEIQRDDFISLVIDGLYYNKYYLYILDECLRNSFDLENSIDYLFNIHLLDIKETFEDYFRYIMNHSKELEDERWKNSIVFINFMGEK